MPRGAHPGSLNHARRIAAAPCHPANPTRPCRGSSQRVPRPRFATWRPSRATFCPEPAAGYYRNPENTFDCLRKGGKTCDALFAENRFHSIFGGMCVSAAPCVQWLPHPQRHPAYMPKLRAGALHEAVAILLRNQPAACSDGAGSARTPASGLQPVRLRRAGYPSVRSSASLGDYALAHAGELYRPPAAESGKRVAIVGAGPAGLTAALLRAAGRHDVTVLTRMPEAGGMLTL